MKIEDVIIKLRINGIAVRVDNNQLKLNARNGEINKELIELVKSRKNEIIEYISRKAEKKSSFESIKSIEKREYYSASSAQKRLYLLQKIDLESVVYNIPYLIQLKEKFDKEKITDIFNQLIARHESFRTSFDLIKGEPVQRIHDQVRFKIDEIEIDSLNDVEIKNVSKRAFDLSCAPLLRVMLVATKEKGYFLMIDMHHIINDGISQKILETEFKNLFSLKQLKPIRLQYKEFSEWQNSSKQRDKIQLQEQYWLKKFSKEVPILDLPIDYIRPKLRSYDGAKVSFTLNKGVAAKIKSLSSQNDLTLYMYILSGFTLLLHKLTGQEDIIIGTPIMGRNHTELDDVIGVFVNTLAIRLDINRNDNLFNFVKKLKENTLESYGNQDYQFEDLVEKVSVERDLGRNPLFDVMYSLADNTKSNRNLSEFDNSNYVHTNGISKFDLSLTTIDYGDQLLFTFEYCTKLFKKETIERFISYFKQIIDRITYNLDCKISEIEILSEIEKQKLLFEFNNSKFDYPRNKTIHELFADQALKAPDNIALIHDLNYITYRELDCRSNQVSRHINSYGLNEGNFIGILMDTSIDQFIYILGILKSNMAYLPLDTALPTNQLQYILKDAGVELVFTNIDLEEVFVREIPCIDVNKISYTCLLNSPLTNQVSPSSLAYIIYTSGSTGKPKGVLITHTSVVNTLNYQISDYNITFKDKILQFSPIWFDASIEQFGIALLSGATLHLVDKIDLIDSAKIEERINKYCLTHIDAVPSYLKGFKSGNLKSLKRVISGGENCPVEIVRKMQHVNFYNAYGPTETSITATKFQTNKNNDILYDYIPIGKPIGNTTVCILNEEMRLQGIGINGELCISGDGLAVGYLNNPELTHQKFIIHPHVKGERMYRTGDVAKWLPDGNIKYIGRIDNQIKIRGFRIEIGEIENVILKHKNIKQCHVIALGEFENKYLCAYVVSKNDSNIENLKNYISKLLPEYMIPSYIVFMETLPLTTNGKINQKALPSPEIKAGKDFELPTTDIENKLLLIWAEVLNITPKNISVTDNFFSIGGHSLKASVLTGKIHENLEVEFPLRDVFLYTTIRSQAKFITQSVKKDFISIPIAKKKPYYRLSSAQKRLYLLQQIEPESITYNMPSLIPLEETFDKTKIEEVFNQLLLRHESLRTGFIIIGEEPVQKIYEGIDFEIGECYVDELKTSEIRNQFMQPFDLSKAPLLRVVILQDHEQRSLLLIDMHHIVSDGISHKLLEKEFKSLYSGEILQPLKLQYKDYSEWQNSEGQFQKVKVHEEYWLGKFKEGIPVLNLPTDFLRPVIQNNEGASMNFILSKDETNKIKSFTEKNGLTLYMSVLSIFGILLSKLSSQDKLVIGTPISGRNHIELENIVGMFVNTLALCINIDEKDTLQEYAQKLKQDTIEAYENQDYQFEDLVEKLSVERDASRNPIFDVMFSLENDLENLKSFSKLTNENLVHTPGISKFDLTLNAFDLGDQIVLKFEYCTKLFKPKTLERYAGYFKQVVYQLITKEEEAISTLEIITAEEKQELLFNFNNTRRNCPKDKVIHQIFQEQVEKFPNKIAIINDNIQITYTELNKRSNQFANKLREIGVKPNSLVGIYGERSINIISSLIGVLKAGGAFLPIDRSTLLNRCKVMLDEGEVQVLITQDDFIKGLDFSGRIIDVENEDLNNVPNTNLENLNKVDDLVYVIYTSGSTGKPKGVLVEHRNLANVHFAWKEQYELDKGNANILQIANFGFDVFVGDAARSFLNGCKMVICPDENRLDFKRLTNLILKQKINVLESTPSLLIPFLNYGLDNKIQFDDLNLIIIGSDSLRAMDYIKIQKEYSNKRILNSYGVTEATIDSSFYEEEKDIYENGNLPIGKPMLNMYFYILNNERLQPIGVSGELYIGGEGISRGYLNNVELTENKFIENPFKKGERLYKTGDLARWLPNGNIEFLGRVDHQVKIRGFRIELGEIESVILKHSSVKECVAVAHEHKKHKNLCAYIIYKDEQKEDDLRRYLADILPHYMIPSYFIEMNHFSMTQNGKVDIKKLPKPEIKVKNYVAPRNEVEDKLVKIWSKVLGLNYVQISIDANFFELGGHSILIIQVVQKINEILEFEVKVIDLFRYTTIKELTTYISEMKDYDVTKYDRSEKITKGKNSLKQLAKKNRI